MLHFLVLVCVALAAPVSCHPRAGRAAAVVPGEIDNYIELPLEQKVKYHYQYGIDDAASGVFSHKWEERLGSYVKGAYSMMEADGRIRTVDYEVDGPKGFHAVVRTSLPGNSFLSSQQLRKSRDSNPNPPVNVLTNNIPSRPVLEARTPRLIHKDLPPNFHSVKPDYFWGSAPGGHAAKHHRQDGSRRGRNGLENGDTVPATHSSFRTPAGSGNAKYSGAGNVRNNEKEVELKNNDDGQYGYRNIQSQERGSGQDWRNANGRNSQQASPDRHVYGDDSIGRVQNTGSRYRNVQSFDDSSDYRTENGGGYGSQRQAKGRFQKGNFVEGVDEDLSGEMLPPSRNAEVMNYDHLLRAGKITDALFL